MILGGPGMGEKTVSFVGIYSFFFFCKHAFHLSRVGRSLHGIPCH